MDMRADMFPIELLSIQSTVTQLTCPPSIPLLVTFTVQVLGRRHSDQVWPLKTSGSRWATPTLPTPKRQMWCVSTCLLPREVKEFKGGISATVLSECIVNSLIGDKKLLSWPDTGTSSVIIQTLSGQIGRNMFLGVFFSLKISKQESSTVYLWWQRGNEKAEAECQLSSQYSLIHVVLNTISWDITWHFETC